MTRIALTLALAGSALALAAAAPGGAPRTAAALSPEEIAAGVRLSAAASDRFQAQLLAALEKAMAEGGVEGAVEVCSQEAPAIAAQVSADTGASVRRTALRTRNPAAAPDGFERAVLEGWVGAPMEAPGRPKAHHAVIAGPDGQPALRYMRAIPLRAQCLACHGDPEQMSEELRATIAARYPADRAVGFAEGDLRGAFSVSWRPEALRAAIAREAAGR